MKRVGIYGGSFAPPHKGHLKSALSFYDECALDELYILPAGEPPHKALQGNADPEERFFMTELTFSKENCGTRKIFVSDYELKKAGKSYSFETAEHFAAPGTELFLAVGSDMFLSFESWKHPEILLRLCTLVLNRREKDLPEQTFEAQKRRLEDLYGARILLSDFVPFRTSSTEIRELLKKGEDPSALLCPAVYEYIKSRNLFFFQEGQLSKIEEYLRDALSAKRFAHVQSVRRELEKMLSFFDLPAGEAFISSKSRTSPRPDPRKNIGGAKGTGKGPAPFPFKRGPSFPGNSAPVYRSGFGGKALLFGALRCFGNCLPHNRKGKYDYR